MKSVPYLRIELGRSRIEALLVAVVHAAAMVTPWYTSLPLWASAGVVLAVCVNLGVAGYRWLSGRRVELTLERDGSWQVRRDGETHAAETDGTTYLGNGLVVLPLRLANGKRLRIVAWPDSAPRQALRQFRVWMKWGEGPRHSPLQSRPARMVGEAAGDVAG